MIEKARENLAASERLTEDGYSNAAASRAYYAAYQACWWALEQIGESVPELRLGKRYWPHKTISESSRTYLDEFREDDEEDFDNILLFRRIKADYDPDPVLEIEARECVEIAANIVKKVSGDDHEPSGS